MSVYLQMLLVTVALGFVCFALLLRRGDLGAGLALLSLPLCGMLGAALAKALYVVLLQADYVLEWGEWDVFLDFQPKKLCFMGGAFGVVLGVFLAARILGKSPRRVLDAFAPAGALMITGFRLAESQLGKLGTGTLVEYDGFFARPPFVLVDSYGDRWMAIYFWEAVVALIVFLLALFSREKRPGLIFHRAVFRLCVCQILLESMRSQSMRWGFVGVEMVLCAVVLLALLAAACRRSGRDWWAIPALFVLLGAIVGEEFARQKASSPFLADYGYVFMAVILLGMLVLDEFALRGVPASSDSVSA